ncbi:hypothetical protein C8R45DRAFT_1050452 [Mycena sanguinolenta]|nr:hypothetical protein C8R45DRAFT_1050452 [Mycena sanguinolenta]
MNPSCKYCRVECRTIQGLHSHLAQSKQCREKHIAEYEDSDSSDSASDSAQSSGNLSQQGGDNGDVTMDYEPADNDVDDGPLTTNPPPANFGDTAPNAATTAPGAEDGHTRKRRRPRVEEVEDEDARWVQPFPEEYKAGVGHGHCETAFQKLRKAQEEQGHAPWEPFDSKDIWELGHWLMTSCLSGKKIDAYLKLKTVHEGSKPSFHNNRKLLQYIDALPDGPRWTCYPFQLVGEEIDAEGNKKTEIVEMWCRDPVECVRELVGNPAFTKQCYEPCHIFKRCEDGTLSNREFNEMWTGDWWWEAQLLLPVGATLVPIIIASDKTQLTRFSGDKQAWPSLKDAGREGVKMDCADGVVRKTYLIIDAYIADYPEQCLVCCCGESSCPGCTCSPKCRGHTTPAPWRCPEEVLRILAEQSNGERPVEFGEQNLRAINPFWKDFPHCNIFRSMTPDLLHELHNGVFVDHIERRKSTHPSLRHFKKGISLTTQWTGRERKNMEKVFLGVLAGVTQPRVQLAARAVLDFIHYAHFETHCDESLVELDKTWQAFHDNKDIFVDLGIREHFNVSKLHKLKHYVDSIRSRGTADGFNSEGTERLHIDLAKVGYNASNRREYVRQMTVWLRRQERVHKFGSYLQWAVPGYTAPSTSDEGNSENGDVDDDADEVEEGPAKSADLPDDSNDSDDEVDQLPTFSIAKKPTFPSATVASIVSDFAAPAFLTNIERFLASKSIVPLLTPADNSTFPVYRRFSLFLPTIDEAKSSATRDTIRAVKAAPQHMTTKGVKRAKAGQFDTVLVRTRLGIARVRVIFRIPSDFGGYHEPVAYVDWFKPLQRHVADLGMHQVSLSSQNLRQRSSIIPLTDIVRSCHLIPVFGRSVNPRWEADTVLDQCKSFYLNPYLRHHDFYLFRYLSHGNRQYKSYGTAAEGYEELWTAIKSRLCATSATGPR